MGVFDKNMLIEIVPKKYKKGDLVVVGFMDATKGNIARFKDPDMAWLFVKLFNEKVLKDQVS